MPGGKKDGRARERRQVTRSAARGRWLRSLTKNVLYFAIFLFPKQKNVKNSKKTKSDAVELIVKNRQQEAFSTKN